MNEPGIVERWRRVRPEMVAVVVGGLALGGAAGATFKGSGMFFSNVILGGGLLLLLALMGLAALVAASTHRPGTARLLTGFIGVTVVSTGVAYAVAPPFRSPDAGIDHLGTAVVRIAELTPAEWEMVASCRTREGQASVFQVSMSPRKHREPWLDATLGLRPAEASSPAGLWLSLVAPPDMVQYTAPRGSDLVVTLGDADGMTGEARFSAALVPASSRTPGPEPARLTGTVEWACGA